MLKTYGSSGPVYLNNLMGSGSDSFSDYNILVFFEKYPNSKIILQKYYHFQFFFAKICFYNFY